MGMKRPLSSTRAALATVIVVHLVLCVAHGTAHARANVPMSPAANVFVFTVILAGPLLGLALTWPSRRLGGWLIAATLTASLVFGVLNHFAFTGADHVSHIEARWQPLFATTAVLLALTESLGSVLAIAALRERTGTL